MRTCSKSHLRAKSHLKAIQIFFLAAVVSAAATPPNFSGKWTLNASQSQDTDAAAIELTIKDQGGKIAYERTLREKDGKEIRTTFTCAPVGTSCELVENGHKAKVSLWYDGAALMMAKTGGPTHDAVTERKFELSPDGKTLTVEFTNYSGSGKAQKLVFIKQ